MRRMAWPLASTLLALSACNALTGVSELSTCPSCGDLTELDSGVTADGAKLSETSMGDASTDTDGRDSSARLDASTDADGDTDAVALTGCLGATACVRVMFATSVGFTGNLGGIAGADAKCQALADLSTNSRIKGRAFVAWVSTAASPVDTRLTHGTTAYLRPDNVLIALSYGDLTDNSIQSGINIDELGGNRNGAGAWTATNSGGGGYAGSSCADWTVGTIAAIGEVGNVGGNGSGWSASFSDKCDATHSLYCVER